MAAPRSSSPNTLLLLLLLAVASLHPRTCRATMEEEASACRTATWKCSAANSHAEGDYAIALDSETYIQSQLITVKVYMKQCPTLSMPGPRWYRLTAVDDRSAAVGEFIEKKRSETFDCPSSNSIIFSTCEPFVLDLPRSFVWRAPVTPEEGELPLERACFRLSILAEGDTNCTTVTKCIEPHTPPSPEDASHGSGSGESSGDNSTEEISAKDTTVETAKELAKRMTDVETPTISEERRTRCLKNNNCTGKPIPDFGGFCGSDNKNYSTRCHAKLHRCLYQVGITLSQGLCIPPTPRATPPTPPKPCPTRKEEYEEDDSIHHTPGCDCDGFFKPVQCDHYGVCWCSFSRGSEQFGTDRALSCTDPETFEFSCSV